MDFSSDLEQGRCLEWYTELPYRSRSRESPVFMFQKRECYFLFIKEHGFCNFAGDIYYNRIYMKQKKDPIQLQPFRIKIYVTYNNAIISFTDDFLVLSTRSSIWSAGRSEFNSKLKASVNHGTFIRFLFIFYDVRDLPLQPEEFETERQTVTPLYLDDNPCRESLSQDFNRLFEDQPRIPPDVQLKCGDLIIQAHKTVLCARSEVFAAMLNSDMLEARTGVVEIQDMDETVFQEFVHYLYTGTMLEMNFVKAQALYDAGDKYAVSGLTKRCVRIFASNLADENACEILALADAHSDNDLKEVVTTYILDKKLYLQNDRWVLFSKSHPALAVEVLNRFFEQQKQ